MKFEARYSGGWNPQKVAEYLVADPDFCEWRNTDFGPSWIDRAGEEFDMMDDNDNRALATWKFVADRGGVTREEILEEFPTAANPSSSNTA